jgi:hypothetical protein
MADDHCDHRRGMMWWQDKDHPVWSLLRLPVLCACALALSWANASHFDGGEVLTALGTVGAAAALFRGGK